MRRALTVLLCALLPLAPLSAAEPVQEARFRLELDLDERRLRGEGTLRVFNRGAKAQTRLPLVLYPARFRALDPEITDLTFRRYYARWFDRGDMALTHAAVAGAPLQRVDAWLESKTPPGAALWLKLPQPLAPGDSLELELAFELELPLRLGTFGVDRGRVVLDGGFLPYVPVAGFRSSPARTRFALELSCKPAPSLAILGPQRLPAGRGQAEWEGFAPFLAAGPDLLTLVEHDARGEPPIVIVAEEELRERSQRMLRVAREANDVLRRYLPEGAPLGRLLLVQAPLRDRFTQVTDEAVLVSDRLFRLLPILRPFHEVDLGRAVIQALVRQRLARLELGADRDWLAEGIAWWLTREWATGRTGLKGSQVRRSLEFFSFIPAIDQLVRAPRFIGSDLFYGNFYEPQDAVPDAFPRALSRRARGRVPIEKLRDKVGDEPLEGLMRALLSERPPDARQRAAQLTGEDLDAFFALWLEGGGLRTPRQDIGLEVETLRDLPGGGRRVRVTIRREDADPRIGQVGEPVTVAAVDSQGKTHTATWSGKGEEGEVEIDHYGGLLDPIVLDPYYRVAQRDRGEDESPQFPLKILLNRLSVSVDLNRANRNEASVGTTIIPFRNYAHRIGLDAFYQQDERGVALSYSYGFGWSIDERTYGVGVGLGFTASRLTTGVLSSNAQFRETKGNLISFSGGVSFDTRIFREDPDWGIAGSFGYETSDKSYGSDVRFHLFDAELRFLYSPIRGTTLGVELVATQVNGSDIPSQRLPDAGGEGNVRGIQPSEFVDRAFMAVRTELRQFIFEDLDINLLYLIYVRRIQLVLFLDAGDVGEDLDVVFRNRTDWKWGTGFGFRLWGKSFGVTDLIMRFDIGFRIDETDDLGPRYYLGFGQTF